MLFKFKSQAASDLIMLEVDARSLLKIMLGDDPVKGILLTQNLDACITLLEDAVQRDTQVRQQRAELANSPDDEGKHDHSTLPAVSLSQRAAPMLKMLKRCKAEASEIVWGV